MTSKAAGFEAQNNKADWDNEFKAEYIFEADWNNEFETGYKSEAD